MNQSEIEKQQRTVKKDNAYVLGMIEWDGEMRVTSARIACAANVR